jgi:hypothetical protein
MMKKKYENYKNKISDFCDKSNLNNNIINNYINMIINENYKYEKIKIIFDKYNYINLNSIINNNIIDKILFCFTFAYNQNIYDKSLEITKNTNLLNYNNIFYIIGNENDKNISVNILSKIDYKYLYLINPDKLKFDNKHDKLNYNNFKININKYFKKL